MKKFLVFFTAIALVAAFTVPAMAASEWDFYGHARFQTFSVDKSKDATTFGKSDTDTTWDLLGTSRIGANVKAGDVGGRFEFNPTVGTRLLYGTWNFGAGTLGVGQNWSVISLLYSNQHYADTGLGGYGDLGYRVKNIWLQFGGLKVALVTPETGGVVTNTAGTTATAAVAGNDYDVTLPKLEVAYHLGLDAFGIDLGAGYQTVELVTGPGTAGEKSYDVDSWKAQLGFTADFGPFFAKMSAYMAQNEAAYGAGTSGYAAAVNTNAILDGVGATTKLQDNDSYGYQIIAGFKVNDMLTLEAGYGAVHSEWDFNYTAAVKASVEDEASSYYINAKVTLAENVFIYPEIGIMDADDIEYSAGGVSNKVKEGDITYFGAKWEIRF